MPAIAPAKQIGKILPNLKGKYFYAKGTGKRMRDLARRPMENGSIIRIFEDMYLRHVEENADVSVAVLPYTLSVPYAILSTDNNGCVTSIEEKPTYTYFANAGIYIFRNTVLLSMAEDTHMDATDLIESVIARGGKVVCHPVNGTWIDIGAPADFQRASEMMRHHRDLSARR